MPPAGIFAGKKKQGERPEGAGLLLSLQGQWRLSRSIEDRLGQGGGQGAFEGEAVFEPTDTPAVLAYRETGLLTLAGQVPLRAERRYLWRATGALVEVAFGDGRPFHTFDPDALRPDARHECAPDLYRVAYDFEGLAGRPARWEAEWEVKGPRKDYRMVSRYERAG